MKLYRPLWYELRTISHNIIQHMHKVLANVPKDRRFVIRGLGMGFPKVAAHMLSIGVWLIRPPLTKCLYLDASCLVNSIMIMTMIKIPPIVSHTKDWNGDNSRPIEKKNAFFSLNPNKTDPCPTGSLGVRNVAWSFVKIAPPIDEINLHVHQGPCNECIWYKKRESSNLLNVSTQANE